MIAFKLPFQLHGSNRSDFSRSQTKSKTTNFLSSWIFSYCMKYSTEIIIQKKNIVLLHLFSIIIINGIVFLNQIPNKILQITTSLCVLVSLFDRTFILYNLLPNFRFNLLNSSFIFLYIFCYFYLFFYSFDLLFE